MHSVDDNTKIYPKIVTYQSRNNDQKGILEEIISASSVPLRFIHGLLLDVIVMY